MISTADGVPRVSNEARARVATPSASMVGAGMMPAVLQMLATDEGRRHFQHVRMFFEAGLAREEARHAGAADLARRSEALAANRAAVGDNARFIETDIAFHFVLAQMTRNPVFAALRDAMSTWLKERSILTPGRDRAGRNRRCRPCPHP